MFSWHGFCINIYRRQEKPNGSLTDWPGLKPEGSNPGGIENRELRTKHRGLQVAQLDYTTPAVQLGTVLYPAKQGKQGGLYEDCN